MGAAAPGTAKFGLMLLFGGLGTMILGAISQAAVLYGAFDDMRGRPVDLVESLRIGLRRFFPLLGVVLLFVVFILLGAAALVFPAFIVMTMLFGGKGRLADIMGDVGKGIRNFKKGLSHEDEPGDQPPERRE